MKTASGIPRDRAVCSVFFASVCFAFTFACVGLFFVCLMLGLCCCCLLLLLLCVWFRFRLVSLGVGLSLLWFAYLGLSVIYRTGM